MSAVIVGVIKFTCGLLVNKARSKIAERVKHDEDYLSYILRELDDIKGKLNGLARKDLLSSISFLHEGMNTLNQCLRQQFKQIENTTKSTEQATSVEAASPRGAGNGSPINQAIAFMKAVSSPKIVSSRRFKSAKESFVLARTKATEAFCNNALSIEDRIQASQVRITARIFEKLEDPNEGVSDCFQYLRELHDVGDIKDIFSTLINGGIKAKLKIEKEKRLNNARLVHLMNQLLFEFAGEYTSLPPSFFTEWPTILFGGRSYHPVFGDSRVIDKLQESGVRVMSPYPHFKFDEKIFPPHSVVNSKGKIIAELYKENTIKMFQSPDKSETFCKIPNEKHASLCRIVAMDIDAKDNVYVLAGFQEKSDEPWSYKLYIFDQNGKKTLESPLPLLQNSSWIKLRMAVNKDGGIAILNCDEKMMWWYTGSPSGVELNSKSCNGIKVDNELSRTGRGNMRLSDLKIICANRTTVKIYNTVGKLEREIKLPEGHGFITSIAISHTAKRILIQTSILADRFSVLCYSETGKLIDSLYLCLDKLCLKRSKWIEYAKLTSHPNGAVALVGETGAALLQL